MPRRSANSPGGTRVGAPGQAYPNRNDLNAQKNLPARVAGGQTYGKANQQLQAQQTVPMAPQPLTGFGPPAGGGPPLPPPGPMPGGAPPGMPPGGPPPGGPPAMPPGGLGPLAGPTQRPAEPVTAGVNIGPGPGPEANAPSPLGPAAGINPLSSMLAAAASSSGSQALASLAQRAQAAGL